MEKWAKAQGIDAGIFQYIWRSHWQIPSNTALYEMMQRLRPDRPEVFAYDEAYANWISSGRIGDEPLKPLIVTEQDVQTAIEVNDMAPKWVPGLISVAYKPMTRIDAQRAFEVGTFSSDDLYHSLRDNGYDQKSATILVQFYAQQKARRTANAIGVWSIRKVINTYKKGNITRNDAIGLLTPLFANASEIATALDGADLEVKSDITGSAIKRWRKAFFTGSVTHIDAIASLRELGMDASRASELVDMWDSDVKGRYKEPTVSLLRKWAMVGIITAEDMYMRLIRLGYADPDAQRIIYATQNDINVAAKREYEKVAKEAEKRFKDKVQLARQSQEDLQKEIDRITKQREKIQKEIDKRAKLLGLNGQS
jgi:hypothetical protein